MAASAQNLPDSSRREAESALAAFSNDKREHVAKLVGERGFETIGRWVDAYFNEQSAYRNVDEFRFHLETVIDEYVGYYVSSYANVANEQVRRRMAEISKTYHGLIYEGEFDPYADSSDSITPSVALARIPSDVSKSEAKQRELTESVGVLRRISKLLGW